MSLKSLAAVAALLFSVNASAGYVKYELEGPIEGFMVQHEDGSVADYSMFARVPFKFRNTYVRIAGFQFSAFWGDGVNRLGGSENAFGGAGPTNFSNYDNYGGDRDTLFLVTFAPTTQTNQFAYTANYEAGLWMNDGWHYYSGVVKGLAHARPVSAGHAYMLDINGGYGDGIAPRVPASIAAGDPVHVPEPGNVVLLGAGALAAYAASRRRRA